ncbi:MAG: T9SS type A sorting domain-containing protein [Bacteroidales bacterium]|jgi:hypothetical protein|nr:T9SS type A sorting domain-containing protein [Bacteroidales bacterium]
MKTPSTTKIIITRFLLTAFGILIFISGNYAQELLWKNSTDYGYIISGKAGVDNENNVYSLFFSFDDSYLEKFDENGTLLWSKSDTNWTSVGDMYVTAQGNIYLAGSKEVFPNNFDAYCVVFNAQGLFQYEGYYSMTNVSNELITDILVDDDGYAYLSGYGLIDTVFHVFAFRMNPGGTVSWAQTENFDNEHFVQIGSSEMDDSGNLYVSGVHVISVDSVQHFIIKYSKNGQHIYTKKYVKAGYSLTIAYEIIPDQDQNIIFVGAIGTPTITRGYVAKLDQNGEVIWDYTFNPASNEMVLYSADLDENGNIYVSGQIVLSNDQEGYFAKMSPDGNVIWENIYSGAANSYDALFKVIVEGEGCFFAGQTMGITTKTDLFLMKTDMAGNIIWEAQYDGAEHSNDLFEYMTNDRDNNLLISGLTEEAYQKRFGTILKYSNPTGIKEDHSASNTIGIYPNPVQDVLHFYDQPAGSYTICSIKGAEILSGQLDASEIDISRIHQGVYLLRITDGNLIYYAKFVKQ